MPERSERPLRIWWNRSLRGRISPGKLAAHAAHAALAAYGIRYTHPIVVLAAGPRRIGRMPVAIRDAGHTELEPGTLTTGVESRYELSDELVERGAEAFGGITSQDWGTASEWERDEVRAGVRRALEAALGEGVHHG